MGSGQEDGGEGIDMKTFKGDFENRAVTGPGTQLDLSADRFLTTFSVPLWCNKQDCLKMSLGIHFEINCLDNYFFGTRGSHFSQQEELHPNSASDGTWQEVSLSCRRVCCCAQLPVIPRICRHVR